MIYLFGLGNVKVSRGCLVCGNREWELKSHSFFASFLCLDKVYEDRNRIKNDSHRIQIPLISGFLIHNE